MFFININIIITIITTIIITIMIIIIITIIITMMMIIIIIIITIITMTTISEGGSWRASGAGTSPTARPRGGSRGAYCLVSLLLINSQNENHND